MADDAFHELQLSGKQLVFLFMAATVVATVIFLSGVMVGRGVRDQRGEAVVATDANADPTAADVPPVPAQVGGSGGTSAATRESLTYPERLAADAPPQETLNVPEAVSAPASAPERAAPMPPEKPAAPASAAAAGALGGSGFTVQVAAIKERGEADRIAKRLVARGFPAYVTTPTNEAARFFRVRVGKFQDRREADAMARRLETEEQFKPWVTR